MRLPQLFMFSFLVGVGCSESPTTLLDGGGDDSGVVDTGEVDAGPGDTDAPEGGTDLDPPDMGGCNINPDCSGCAAAGSCCFFTTNCVPGAICNNSIEPFYDPAKADNICVQVVCANDADCDPGEVCGLDKTCAPPICQRNEDCAAPELCIGGVCTSDLPVAASCEVITQEYTLAPGQSVRPQVVVRDADGRAIAGTEVSWSSDAPAIAVISSPGTVNALAPGSASIVAELPGVACSGSISVRIVETIPATMSVRVVSALTGEAEVATMEIRADGVTSTILLPDADGFHRFPRPTTIEWITIHNPSLITQGVHITTIVKPDPVDLVVPLHRARFAEAGGVRGAVDVSSMRRSDVVLGMTGAGLIPDLLYLGRVPLLSTETFATDIDAPDLGLQESLDLPGGMIFGLGAQVFTNNAERCAGLSPGADEAGCYLFTMPESSSSLWTLTGRLRISDVAALADSLSDLDPAGPPQEQAIALAQLYSVIRTFNHGVKPFVTPERFGRVGVNPNEDCSFPRGRSDYFSLCRPDYAQYETHNLSASHEQNVRSVIEVPRFSESGTCGAMMTLVAATDLGPRGLAPLGLSVAPDLNEDFGVPDCMAAGEAAPFGRNSSDLMDGEVALASAPRHGGLESGALTLLSVVSSPGIDTFERSVVIERPDRLPATYTMTGQHMNLPTGSFDRNTGNLTFEAPGAGFVQFDLTALPGGTRWTVITRASEASFVLPPVPVPMGTPQPQLQISTGSVVGYDASGDFMERWALTSDVRLRGLQNVQRLASRGCSTDANAACSIQ